MAESDVIVISEASIEARVLRCRCGDPDNIHPGTPCPTPEYEDLGIVNHKALMSNGDIVDLLEVPADAPSDKIPALREFAERWLAMARKFREDQKKGGNKGETEQ